MSSTLVLQLARHAVELPEVVTLSVMLEDGDWLGSYDQLEVWRSRSGETGQYEERTAAAWMPARLPATGGDRPASAVTGPLVAVSNLALQFLLREQTTITATFTGGGLLTLSQAAAQLTAQGQGQLLAYVDAGAHLVVETVVPGTGAMLRVLPSDAAAQLGLPLGEPDSVAFGRDTRLRLVAGTRTYTFSDVAGSQAYFYKVRLRNSVTGETGDFSAALPARQASGVSAAQRVTGYLDLVTLSGAPLAGYPVSLSTSGGISLEGKLLAGGDLLARTDDSGHVEFELVRGQRYNLAVAGLNLAKEISTPTDPSVRSFMLLDSSYSTQDDYFQARPGTDSLLERRTL